VGVDVELLVVTMVGFIGRGMDAVDGADLDARVVLDRDTGLSDDVGHEQLHSIWHTSDCVKAGVYSKALALHSPGVQNLPAWRRSSLGYWPSRHARASSPRSAIVARPPPSSSQARSGFMSTAFAVTSI